MPKQMVEIEVPEGYEFVGYRVPKDGEFVLVNGEAIPRGGRFGEYPILKQIHVSLYKFYTRSLELLLEQHAKSSPAGRWREGQCMFNHLKAIKPELAESIRGTNCDPFYCLNGTDGNFKRFIEFIEANW
jgi:hypothetical protein